MSPRTGAMPPAQISRTDDQPPMSTREYREQFGAVSRGLGTAIEQKDPREVDANLDLIRRHNESMKARLDKLPPQQKLKLHSVSRMYSRGADLVQEGRQSGEDSKLRLGMEKIEDANRQFRQIDEDNKNKK